MNFRKAAHLIRTLPTYRDSVQRIQLLNQNWQRAQQYNLYRQIKDIFSLPDIFSSFQEYTDIFPVTTKMQLREEFERSGTVWERHPRWLTTSGSTGMSLRIPVDSHDLRQRYIRANALRASVGCNTSLPIIQLWGNSTRHTGHKRWLYKSKRKLFDLFAGVYRFEAYNIGPDCFLKIAHLTLSLKFYTIYAYTSFAVEFALFIRDADITIPSPQAVIVTSETTTSAEVQILSDVFRSNVYVEYGLVEFGPLAVKPPQNPYIFDLDNFHIELIGSQIHVTDLSDTLFPLFRYQTNDATSAESLSLLFQIDGRASDLLYVQTVSKKRIQVHSEIFSHCLKDIPDCLSFQCLVDADSCLRALLIQSAVKYTNPDQLDAIIRSSLASYTGCSETLFFNIYTNFPFYRTEFGKTPPIVVCDE